MSFFLAGLLAPLQCPHSSLGRLPTSRTNIRTKSILATTPRGGVDPPGEFLPLAWQKQACCGLLVSLHLACMQVHAAESLTPYQRGLQLHYGLTTDQRIRKCDAGAQPNCVSTSSGTTRLYAPPFLARQSASPQEAMNDFDAALKSMYDPSKVEMVDSISNVEGNGVYRRYAVPSALVDRDYVEILIRENQEVFYRSQGSSTKYIWPIQQPVSDLDAQRKRMATLRETLGWKLLVGSCSVLECYEY